MKNNYAKIILSLMLAITLLLNFSGCGFRVHADDLMEGITANEVAGKETDEAFISAEREFALALFKRSAAEAGKRNVMISPLSVQIALAMTANGAKGNTKSEIESLICSGLTLEELNGYLAYYVENLPSGEKYKLDTANSIWFIDDEDRFVPEKSFLQTNADYYKAQIYRADFSAATLKDINNWAEYYTDGMIDKILDSISRESVMYLINAIVFDAKWENEYEKKDVDNNALFTDINGNEQKASMMMSTESRYIEAGNATGFAKQYKDEKYSFVALLPNEGIDVFDYAASLDADALAGILGGMEHESVKVGIPKFESGYSVEMSQILASLGVRDAFDPVSADFTGIGKSGDGNIRIDEVIHKTYISVDEKGTKAAAVTLIGMKNGSAFVEKRVVLDRPFVYMIVDNSSNIPLFMGVLTSLN